MNFWSTKLPELSSPNPLLPVLCIRYFTLPEPFFASGCYLNFLYPNPSFKNFVPRFSPTYPPNSLLWSRIWIYLHSFIFNTKFSHSAIKHNTAIGAKRKCKVQLSTVTINGFNGCQQISKTGCIKLPILSNPLHMLRRVLVLH